jgi:hypothetical protein
LLVTAARGCPAADEVFAYDPALSRSACLSVLRTTG